MRSACLVRTRFILNNFSGIGLGGVPGPPGPPLGYAPADAERTCRAVGPTQFTPPHQTGQDRQLRSSMSPDYSLSM